MVTPHLIAGKVYDIFGLILEGATVTVTHANISPVLSTTTNSSGEYIIDLSGLSSQWATGESISIYATKSEEGRITLETTISTGGGQTHNLFLAETADFDFEIQSTLPDRYPFVMSMPVHYDGKKVTKIRPLPVQSENPLESYQASDQDVSSDPQYFGFVDRFGKWYIQQYNNSSGTFRYIKGNSNYTTNWSNRTTLAYNYFNSVF